MVRDQDTKQCGDVVDLRGVLVAGNDFEAPENTRVRWANFREVTNSASDECAPADTRRDDIIDTMRKVKRSTTDERMDDMPFAPDDRLSIKLKSGATLDHAPVVRPKGSWQTPLERWAASGNLSVLERELERRRIADAIALFVAGDEPELEAFEARDRALDGDGRGRGSGRSISPYDLHAGLTACAEHLIREHYTDPGRLVIQGGSAGGLLMGAVTNMRPDLFHSRAVLRRKTCRPRAVECGRECLLSAAFRRGCLPPSWRSRAPSCRPCRRRGDASRDRRGTRNIARMWAWGRAFPR